METYTPDDVSVLVGASIIEGWETVVVARDEDQWNFSSGTNGLTTRTKNSNNIGGITITLKQESDANAILNALAISGDLVPVAVIGSGDSTYNASIPEGTVVKLADATLARSEDTDREWLIKGDLFVIE